MFLSEYDEIPYPFAVLYKYSHSIFEALSLIFLTYKVLKFLAGHINYGGRVTDEWDIRTLMNILDSFYTPAILDPNYKLSPSGVYYSPPAESHASYLLIM